MSKGAVSKSFFSFCLHLPQLTPPQLTPLFLPSEEAESRCYLHFRHPPTCSHPQTINLPLPSSPRSTPAAPAPAFEMGPLSALWGQRKGWRLRCSLLLPQGWEGSAIALAGNVRQGSEWGAGQPLLSTGLYHQQQQWQQQRSLQVKKRNEERRCYLQHYAPASSCLRCIYRQPVLAHPWRQLTTVPAA